MKESKLIKRAAHGDADAFAALVRSHLDSFYRMAWSMMGNEADANDAVQDAIVAIWEKLPLLRSPRSFKPWAMRILANKCKDRLRTAKEIALDELPEPSCEDAGSDDVEWQELVGSLDPRYRAPLQLYYGEGFSTREIAAALDIPKSTVTTYLARGREQAKRYLLSGEHGRRS